MSEKKTRAMFEPCLGTKFAIHAFSGEGEDQVKVAIELELVEATELPPSSTNPKHNLRQDPFSLIFEGPKDALLEQGTYTFQHDQLGELEMFMVPVGVAEYEVIFN